MSIGVILALVVALPLFVWALVNLNFNQKEKAASGEPVDIAQGEPFIGLENAPVLIVAYSDFQCTFCKDFVDNTMSTILANYPTQVKFIFKDFPIISTHPLAEKAAFAGQCAFTQDKFWQMHDLIFAKQATLSEIDLGSDFAVQLNLDMSAYNTCFSTRVPLIEIQDDMSEGVFKGVTGTPTFFIGNAANFVSTSDTLIGSQPFSAFKTIIDQKLGSSQPTATASPTEPPIGGGEPNSCGGTCGSNYNCKANLYCYQGYCRNPLCSTDTDCDCKTSATATATARATTRPAVGTVTKTATAKSTASSKSSAKPSATYSSGISRELLQTIEPSAAESDPLDQGEPKPENEFFAKYALYFVAGFILIAIVATIFALKKKKEESIPHILPPTNI